MLQQLNELPPEIRFGALAVFVLGLVLSFALGRRTGSRAGRVRELESTLDEVRADSQRLHEELEGYRKRVAEHFIESSEKLHDLTVQYRSVYEHLARGAVELCPDQPGAGVGFRALPQGLADEIQGLADEIPDGPTEAEPLESAGSEQEAAAEAVLAGRTLADHFPAAAPPLAARSRRRRR